MPSLGLKQYDFPILIFWLLLWSPRYLIRLQGQDWLNTDPWFLTYSSVSFYPFIDSVTQLTAPGVKSFLFYNLLLFLLIKFFKPTGTAHNFFFFGRGGVSWTEIMEPFSYFICIVNFLRLLLSTKLKKVSQTLDILNKPWTLFTLCYHFVVNKNNRIGICKWVYVNKRLGSVCKVLIAVVSNQLTRIHMER